MTEPGRGADVGAIVCGEGLASICVITNHTTIIRQRIDVPVPRKRKGGATALGADKVSRVSLSEAHIRHTKVDQSWTTGSLSISTTSLRRSHPTFRFRTTQSSHYRFTWIHKRSSLLFPDRRSNCASSPSSAF